MDKNIKKIKILIVDDEPLIRQSLYEILCIDGHAVQMCESAEEALKILQKDDFDLVVTDMQLSKMSGIDLLKETKARKAQVEFILITGFGTIESAVNAMKLGAYDFITKPINDFEFKSRIVKLQERKSLMEENKALKKIVAEERRSSFCGMIGSSAKMQRVYHTIECVANTNATILITGESGTGKGMIARAIHEMDQKRKPKPFVEISCGALSETLLESELFGHVKGAFTGAIKDKEGRFEYAKDGTIFLDEIDSLSLSLQVKLLRVIQDGMFERVGDNVTMKTEARIIVATNHSLPKMVEEGKFREDLYYRVNVIAIQPPPLRERKDDIDVMIDFYLRKYSKDNHKNISGVSPEVRRMFNTYHWPGNIRELENAIEGAAIMTQGNMIQKDDVRSLSKFGEGNSGNHEISTASSSAGGGVKSLKAAVAEPEKEYIVSILDECGWNKVKAAAKLGVNRTTLYNKMKKYGICEKM